MTERLAWVSESWHRVALPHMFCMALGMVLSPAGLQLHLFKPVSSGYKPLEAGSSLDSVCV